MVSPKEYDKIVKKNSPKSKLFTNCIKAFLIGGLICTIGQALTNAYIALSIEEPNARTLTSATLIFLGGLLTSIGIYDNIAKCAGAGTLVPITGFANSVAAPCIEFQKEGQVFGIGVKVFTIAGPVILYGVFTSFVLGLIFMILQKVGLA